MLINEVCKQSGLTKKAVAYYVEQGLICPASAENGYRIFSEDDAARLSKVAMLRELGLSVTEIKTVLAENCFSRMQDIYEKKALELAEMQTKQQLLRKLMETQDGAYIREQLTQLERKQLILTRLLERFPGYYGKFICLHFAPYLNEPITTQEQQDAFETILAFLDRVNITIPEDLQDYLEEATNAMDTAMMEKINDNMAAALQNPAQYLEEHKDMLQQYEAVKASAAYKSTPAYKLQALLAQLNQENGYNDIFIPAMRRLSNSYRTYFEKLATANALFQEEIKR